jgi:hypothetical protein
MGEILWKEIFKDSQYNTAIAASGNENFISTAQQRVEFGPFNRLMIKNRDSVAIKILLDGLNEAGKIFELAAGETLLIEPEDGITFNYVNVINLDTVNAETADTILIRWAKAIQAG